MILRKLSDDLLLFQRQPGQFALALRQPESLFSETKTIVSIATGRYTAQGFNAMTDVERQQLTDAARFFVRTAFLRPGVDRYGLLGLSQDASLAEVKERYRQMIWLTHPDHVRGQAGYWPADTVPRLNAAYAALKVGVQSTDGEGSPNSPRLSRLRKSDHRGLAAGKKARYRAGVSARIRKLLVPFSAGTAAVGLMAVFLIWSGSERDQKKVLIQKPVAAQVAAVKNAVVDAATLAETGNERTFPALESMPRNLSEGGIGSPQLLGTLSLGMSAASHPPSQSRAAKLSPSKNLDSEYNRTQATIATGAMGRKENLSLDAQADVAMATENRSFNGPSLHQPIVAHLPNPSAIARMEVVDIPPMRLTSKADLQVPLREAELWLAASRPTLNAVQPVIVKMLEQLENGRAELLLPLIDGSVQSKAAIQDFLLRLNTILESAPDRKVEAMVFSVDPEGSKGDRLRVKGHVRLLLIGSGAHSGSRRNVAMHIDFVNRNGRPLAVAIDGREVAQ